jgi:hypothetical protein
MELNLALKGKHSKMLISATQATIPNQFLKAKSGTIYKEGELLRVVFRNKRPKRFAFREN